MKGQQSHPIDKFTVCCFVLYVPIVGLIMWLVLDMI
jgi:hypothetical protein